MNIIYYFYLAVVLGLFIMIYIQTKPLESSQNHDYCASLGYKGYKYERVGGVKVCLHPDVKYKIEQNKIIIS